MKSTLGRPLVMGMAGGTGSGKTTAALEIKRQLGPEKVVIIHHDAYYVGRSHFGPDEKINFDHPSAFDNKLLTVHLRELLNNRPIDQPLYDFATHERLSTSRRVMPTPIILLEGILVLENSGLRGLMDIKIYVDADSDERFIRRLLRDTHERDRTLESVIEQYVDTVKPMHLQFVEPSKRYADLIIPGGGYNKVAIDLLVSKIRSILGET